MRKIATGILIAGIAVTFNACQKVTDNVAPEACFNVTPAEIHAGDVVTFNSDCSANASSFSWDFGDGSSSTDASPTHTYNTAGDYTVILTVKDAGGLSKSSSQTITVQQASVPQGNTHEGNITADETWAEGIHEITGDVYIDGATLTIEPGCTIKFDQGTGLYIGYNGGTAGATLIANGTADKPILFTSAATTQTAGDWDYIGFYSGASSNSSMKYCTVEYAGGYSSDYGAIDLEDASVAIEDSYVRFSASSGVSVNENGSFKSFVSDTLKNNMGYAIEIYGNHAHTIGLNNYFDTETGIRVFGDTYNQTDETWNKLNCPYIIDGDLYIQNTTGAKLTLAPGTKIAFAQNSGIYIGYDSNTFGTLVAEGTASDSIWFTSAAPAGNKTPGDWDYIGFYDGAGSSSVMKYCSVEYGGGYSQDYGEVYIEGSSVKIDNSRISHSVNKGIVCDTNGRFGSFTNNALEFNESYPVEIYADYAHTVGTGNTYNDPGILVNATTVSSNVTWLKQPVPYIIDGIVYVESTSGNTLTLEPGTAVEFTNNSEMDIGYDGAGDLVAQGSVSEPITFTSSAPSGNESPGDWDGIWFYDGTGSTSVMDHCIVSYGGGYSTDSGNITTNGAIAGRPTISNCTITDSNAYGIYINPGDSPTLSGNTFSNNASGDTN